MDNLRNSLNISFQDDLEIQDLIKQLQDAKSELQRTKDEVERVNNDANKCREELDRRMMAMLQMDEGLWNALVELDAVMQEKLTLTDQLERSLSSVLTVESKVATLKSLQEVESSLLEQEHSLKLKHEQLRKALADASSDEEVLQIARPVSRSSSSQSKSSEKSVRKRRARK